MDQKRQRRQRLDLQRNAGLVSKHFPNNVNVFPVIPNFKEANMPLKEKAIESTPSILRLVLKALAYSKGGFNSEEKKELGADLLELALVLLTEAAEDIER